MKQVVVRSSLLALVLAGAAGACSGTTNVGPQSPEVAAATPAPPPSCERLRPGTGAVRLDTTRQGGAVTLARINAVTFAYVADEDSQALHTINLETAREIATTPLSGSPAHAMVLADGRVAVTIRDRNLVEILEPAEDAGQPLERRCTLPVADEPFGIAATPDDQTLLVTSGWGHALTAFDAASAAMEKRFSVDLPREPRGVVVDDDGERAFVSHMVGGDLSVIDLTTKEHKARKVSLGNKAESPFVGRASVQRTGGQGFALAKTVKVDKKQHDALPGEKPLDVNKTPKPPVAAQPPKPKSRVVIPMVTVDPGDPGVRSTAYYGDMALGTPRIAPMVSVIDTAAERSMTKSVLSLGDRPSKACVLPRAVAARPSTGTLLVACLGIDAIVEMDGRGLDPSRVELRRFSVPSGPTGVAVDDERGIAVVWSQFDPGVTILKLDSNAAPKVVGVRYAPPASVKQLAEGRKLYHLTDDPRIASDGIACASCHPDGRDDSFTWATPDGPRQTIMLAGRMATSSPYGWVGKHDNLPDYVNDTFRRLGGSGLQGKDVEDLLTFVQGAPGPLQTSAPERSDELIARGKTLFNDEAQGCAACHLGGGGVDRTLHDVGSTAAVDVHQKYDTPSLHFIRGSAPYFHDGRYETLEDLLKANDHRMGKVMHLPQRDVQALAAFLETL